MLHATVHNGFPVLVSPSSRCWSSSPWSIPRPTCLGTSLCQQCTTKQMARYTNSVPRALSEYVRHSSDFKMPLPSSLSLMADESRANPSPSRDSNWLGMCIKCAYDKYDIPTPEGVKDYQTFKMAVTYADMAGADFQTFVRRLHVPGQTPICFPGSIGSMPSPTLMWS